MSSSWGSRYRAHTDSYRRTVFFKTDQRIGGEVTLATIEWSGTESGYIHIFNRCHSIDEFREQSHWEGTKRVIRTFATPDGRTLRWIPDPRTGAELLVDLEARNYGRFESNRTPNSTVTFSNKLMDVELMEWLLCVTLVFKCLDARRSKY